jgi:hypothetical protein
MNRTNRSIFKKFMLAVVAIVLLTAGTGNFNVPKAHADAIWDHWVAADLAVKTGNQAAAVPHWRFLVEHYASVEDWESAALFSGWLDEYYDSINDYDQAIHYYELENEYWTKDGKDWGAPDIERANQIRTTVEVYISSHDDALNSAQASGSGPLAKFEPEYGTYLGLYPERDPKMGNDYTKTEQIYGKRHAVYLAYTPWGQPFPGRYADNASQVDGALQVALEPSDGLAAVKDGDYLRKWARAAAATGIPIFLRYASEMNGDWTAWHGNPQQYIEKFRLIHDVMAEEAPNVAMVWSPNDVPAMAMDPYYPGDDYVDWVGVSLYTEPFSHGNKDENMTATSPVERLDYVYSHYADRKPIMISETGVSHYSSVDDKSYTDWARMNLARIYQVMPYKYPRLKLITYFNVDKTKEQSANNYMIDSDAELLDLYRKMISDGHFLSEVVQGVKPADRSSYIPLSVHPGFEQQATIVPFVKIPDIYIGRIDYVLNGDSVASQEQAPYGITLKAGQVPPGSILQINVSNRDGNQVASRSFDISSQVSVQIDGDMQNYEQPPVIIEGNTLAPLRAIFESLGAQVTWDSATQTATGRKVSRTIVLQIGSSTALIDGKPVQLEQPAQLVNGNTMAPARFVGVAFGGKVGWDGVTRTVTISTK